VTVWLAAALALLVGLVPLLVVLARADTLSRVVVLQTAGVNVALVFVLLAQHFDRSFYADEAVVLAFLSLVGGLAMARVLERWR
jgi:multisubunit Na+/H+ antiporter MnhF subunit